MSGAAPHNLSEGRMRLRALKGRQLGDEDLVRGFDAYFIGGIAAILIAVGLLVWMSYLIQRSYCEEEP